MQRRLPWWSREETWSKTCQERAVKKTENQFFFSSKKYPPGSTVAGLQALYPSHSHASQPSFDSSSPHHHHKHNRKQFHWGLEGPLPHPLALKTLVTHVHWMSIFATRCNPPPPPPPPPPPLLLHLLLKLSIKHFTTCALSP